MDFTEELRILQEVDGLPPSCRVCGVDEAGRGPIAGPVVAAAVSLDSRRAPSGLDDSKRLSAERREQLAALLRRDAAVAVGIADEGEIERLNILGATMLAMARAISSLSAPPDIALIDGNRTPAAGSLPCRMRAVVRGDRLCPSIAAASVIAKTVRDGIMHDLAREHPGYGWERNAGYPTAAHLAALNEHGVTCRHRVGFAPVRRLLETGATERR